VNSFPEKDLLGYVVGALDAPEQRNLQAEIDVNPELEEQLLAVKNALAPLDYLECTGSRPGLARRTCELVANLGQPPIRRLDPTKLAEFDPATTDQHASVHSVLTEALALSSQSSSCAGGTHSASESANDQGQVGAQRQSARGFSSVQPAEFQRFSGRRWHFTPVELAVTAGALLILAGVLFPAIAHTRHQSRITHCQDNLRQIGTSLIAYSELNHGRFVDIPRSGPLSVAGIVAPMLKENGLLENDLLFSCPGVAASSDQPPVRIPTIEAIQTAVGEQLLWLQRTMSGHYGYSLGYQSEDGYQAPTNQGRSNSVIVADTPSVGSNSRLSRNHDGKGQNLLFEDGRVQFCPTEWIGEDSISVNDCNIVAPGCHPYDNVIARSHVSPAYQSTQLETMALE
jgi:hypothetical protein